MKFEEIIPEIRKGKKFRDTFHGTIYRFNKKKGYVEKLETDLKYDDRKKPYWTEQGTDFYLDELLSSDWEVVEDDR